MIEQSPSSEDYWRDNPPHPNPDKIAWQYNRTIGWIELYAEHTTIKSNLYLKRGDRIPRHFSRIIFDYRGKFADVATRTDCNETIRNDLEAFLIAAQKGEYWSRLSRYHIDSSLLLRNIEYMDLKQIIEDLCEQRLHET